VAAILPPSLPEVKISAKLLYPLERKSPPDNSPKKQRKKQRKKKDYNQTSIK
jgi:hypothetical protein